VGKKTKKRAGGANPSRNSAGDADSLLLDARTAYQNGKLSHAAKHYREYLKFVPDNAAVWHELGGALFQTEHLPGALKALENACLLDPEDPDFASDLGGLYLSLGKTNDAQRALEASLALSADSVGAHYNLSIVYNTQSRAADSIASLIRCISIEPEFADAHYNLGVAFRDQGDLGKALSAFEKVLGLQPENTQAMLDIARCHRDLGAVESALRNYENYLRSNNDVDVIVEYAEILYNNGDIEQAQNFLIEQSKQAPNADQIQLSLGIIRQNMGDVNGAQIALHRALELNSSNTSAILGLSTLRRVNDADDPLFAILREALNRSVVGTDDTIALHFSIAKIYDDVGAHDDAFRHYVVANNAKREKVSFSAENIRDHRAIKDHFNDRSVAALRDLANVSDLPILVVGMPRSGTTLAEQVISSHSAATGAGELQYFPSLVAKLPAILESEMSFPGCLVELTQSQAGTITSNYIELLQRHSPAASRVTDKLPGNYMNVGLFLGLFPNGRVISCRRDPLDVVLSIYFQYFAQGHDYAWDLGHIADRYIDYHRLMDHWRDLFPDAIFEVHYDKMINDFDVHARQLVDFCGLQWEDDCAKFYENRRDVKTASNWQVRQPIYNSSLARWKNYEKHINQLVERLAAYRN
jgi:tetratricopeptide (TPR) repeat protein